MPFLSVIIPIIGARTEPQIKDNLGCLDFELTSDQLKRLEKKSKIHLRFPHDFMSEAAGFSYMEILFH